jgi:hypothetical protein
VLLLLLLLLWRLLLVWGLPLEHPGRDRGLLLKRLLLLARGCQPQVLLLASPLAPLAAWLHDTPAWQRGAHYCCYC